LKKQNNFFDIVIKNAPFKANRDFYHYLLKISWPLILFYYFLFYLIVNLIFAILYWLVPGSLSLTDASLVKCFFFSIQTFSTVGYGVISPASLYGNIIVSIEIIFGLISMAVTTGLVFAKFSKPSSKIMFTNNALITTINGEKVLTFRCANARNNKIISANIELNLLFSEKTKEGHPITRFVPLKLQRNYSPIFALSWSIFHTINEDSPLFNYSIEEMKKNQFEFIVIINGTDDTYYQGIHHTHYYRPEHLIADKYFIDILQRLSDGTRVIDYEHFHHYKEL
jgi:inward rectifier potassium channel